MTVITEWVMQIIVFILIGTIIELLVPNNSMKKYVNIVLGLLLLVILAKPILFIFQVDVTSELDKVENALFQADMPMSQTESFVELQKKDIQAEQAAYIWNEVKSELMNEVNHVLDEEYNVQITDISFELKEELSENADNLDKIIVTLSSAAENDQKDNLIEPVHIDMNQEKPQQTRSLQNKSIKTTLEDHWEDVNKEQIQLIWEGGTF